MLLSLPSFAGWQQDSVLVDNLERHFVYYIPANYTPSAPVSVVVGLHGLGGTMQDIADLTDMSAVADTANIILISPQALDFSYLGYDLGTAWNTGMTVNLLGQTIAINPDVNDVLFIQKLVDSVRNHYAVADHQVFVTGISMGGFMTQRLAAEASDYFDAAASVSGTYALGLPAANPSKVIPIMHIHGTADSVVSYDGSFVPLGVPVGTSADSLVQMWVGLSHSSSVPAVDAWDTAAGPGLKVTEYRYHNATDTEAVLFYKISNGEHTWYDNSNTGNYLNYSTEIWNFFSRHKGGTATGVPDIATAFGARLYPNPVHDRMHISFTQDKVNYEIMDITGKRLKNGTLTHHSGTIALTSFARGTYLILLTDATNGHTGAATFVVQ